MPCHNCHYIKPDGQLCGSPALRNHIYCYFHKEAVSRAMRRSQYARRAAAKINTSRPNSNKPKDLAPVAQQPQ